MNQIDMTGWNLKKKLIKVALDTSVNTAVKKAAQFIYKETTKNLSGPSINPKVRGKDNPAIGKMPVPRRTGNLAESLTMQPIDSNTYAVFTDHRKAGYDIYVHDGHRSYYHPVHGGLIPAAKPRRYLGDVVTQHKEKIIKEMGVDIKEAIRTVGR